MLIALVIVTLVVSAPIVACLLVSVASTREDSAYSLGNHAPGPVQAAARRILDFHTDAPSSLWYTRGTGDPGRERPTLGRVIRRRHPRLDIPETSAASEAARFAQIHVNAERGSSMLNDAAVPTRTPHQAA